MRLWYFYADILQSLGRSDEAARWFAASAALDVDGGFAFGHLRNDVRRRAGIFIDTQLDEAECEKVRTQHPPDQLGLIAHSLILAPLPSRAP